MWSYMEYNFAEENNLCLRYHRIAMVMWCNRKYNTYALKIKNIYKILIVDVGGNTGCLFLQPMV